MNSKSETVLIITETHFICCTMWWKLTCSKNLLWVSKKCFFFISCYTFLTLPSQLTSLKLFFLYRLVILWKTLSEIKPYVLEYNLTISDTNDNSLSSIKEIAVACNLVCNIEFCSNIHLIYSNHNL